ncbi:uncharacterized protein LOC142588069 isoform X2 [Dermacentor variabilis]|uniref:uncharacterized protein LOC142588069 isoform X2 n=1 Tax=Dermacentor variabilis TaxID=34621 RepID=UPI003F5C9233
MNTSRLEFPSLFEMLAASGLCPMPSEIDVLNDSAPCDKGLLDVLQQLEALVTGGVTPTMPEFEPSSNFVAMLVIGWLVARENALLILLQRIISPAGTGVAKKQDSQQQQQQQPVLAGQESCRLAWSQLRLSFKSLATVMQQHASLLHRAQQWLPRDNEQHRALKAYIRWQKEEQPLLWQALLARHPHGSAELRQYKTRLQRRRDDGRTVADQLTSLAERCPGFWP